jgi:ribonucleoside-diphosphate reductase alpha chain
VSNGGLTNVSYLIRNRTLDEYEMSCPLDKNKKFQLNEYVISADIARSESDNNNKTAIAVFKIVRSLSNVIRQVWLVNLIEPPNGLTFEEQSIEIKKIFYRYGGNLDVNKSRVKAIVVDANGVGQGVVEELLKEQTDPSTNGELGAFATINTDDKSKSYAPEIVYSLKAQAINGDIIRIFINYVESNKLKLLRQFDDYKDKLTEQTNKIELEQACINTQFLIDEVSNLRLKKTTSSISVEPVVKRIDKDRYSAVAYGLYYLDVFLNEEVEEDDDDGNFVLW